MLRGIGVNKPEIGTIKISRFLKNIFKSVRQMKMSECLFVVLPSQYAIGFILVNLDAFKRYKICRGFLKAIKKITLKNVNSEGGKITLYILFQADVKINSSKKKKKTHSHRFTDSKH